MRYYLQKSMEQIPFKNKLKFKFNLHEAYILYFIL